MSARARRSLILAVELAIAGIIAWFAWRTLSNQWSAVRVNAHALRPNWGMVGVSSLLVLGTYAMLVEVWRRMLHAWGDSLPFVEASRIWFVSSLGRYIPGKLWQVGAMGMMARRRGVSAVAAGGSALLTTVLSILSGLAVVSLTGARALAPYLSTAGAIALGSLALGIIAAPWLLPPLARIAGQVTGRDVALPQLPARAVWTALIGSGLSWVFYGIAFQVFTRAMLGQSSGATPDYIAVYSASYLVGFLVLFAPGGVGFRELAMIPLMQSLGLASAADAALVAVTSRLWLTVLEILPGLLFLALARQGGGPLSSTDPADAS